MQNLYRPTVVRRGILRSLLDHKFKIIGIWLLLLGAALAYTALSERQYASEAKLFVRLGRESVNLDPTASTGQMVSVQETRDGEINSLFELLGSRVVLEQVVEEVGADRILNQDGSQKKARPRIVKAGLKKLDQVNLNPFQVYSRKDAAIKVLENALKIGRPHKTHMLVLEYESHDPELSQEVLAALIAAGRDAHLRVHVSPASKDFFAEQSDLFLTQLTQLEDKLNAFKNEEGIADLGQQRELHLARIGVLEEELSRTEASLQSTLAELATRETALEEMPELVVLEETEGMPAVPEDNMREQLYQLEIREKELLARYQPEHFLIQQVQDQIQMAREVLELQEHKTQTTRGINDTRQTMELAIFERRAVAAGLKAQIASLNQQIASARSEVERLNRTDVAIARQTRNIDVAVNNYLTHVSKLEQARIDEALENAQYSNLSVLQPPSFSETPTSPDMLINVGLAILLAMTFSLGVVLLSERQVLVEAAPAPVEPAGDGQAFEQAAKRRSVVTPGNPR